MKKFLFLMICLFSISAEARVKMKGAEGEGGTSHGGGGGVICDQPEKGHEAITTLDYYEARIQYGSLLENGENSVVQRQFLDILKDASEEKFIASIELMLTQLPELQSYVSIYLNKIGKIQTDWQNTKLDVFNDSGKKYVLKPGCRYVQLAVREGENIRADLDLIKTMTPAHRAILRLHEAIYYAAKSKYPQLQDSVVVRDILSRIIAMISLSEFVFDPPKEAITDSQKYAFGPIQVLNNFELTNLCKVAETVGLCHVNKLFTTPFEKMQYDRFFEGYHDDQMRTLKRSIQDMKPMSKNIRVFYKNKTEMSRAFQQYHDDYIYARSRFMTVPVLLSSLEEEAALYKSMHCALMEEMIARGQPVDQENLGPGFKSICRLRKEGIQKTFSRIKTGYVREFCYTASGTASCKKINIPSLNLNVENAWGQGFLSVDYMDLRNKVLIDVSVDRPEEDFRDFEVSYPKPVNTQGM